MSELQRLAEADHRFEEAVEMLRDLLDEHHLYHLMLALTAYQKIDVSVPTLKAVLEFLDWLWENGDHLDTLLAEIHGIDLNQAQAEARAARVAILEAAGRTMCRPRATRLDLGPGVITPLPSIG